MHESTEGLLFIGVGTPVLVGIGALFGVFEPVDVLGAAVIASFPLLFVGAIALGCKADEVLGVEGVWASYMPTNDTDE